MTPQEFVAKWSKIQQKETAVSQSHFFDICRLVGHPTPTDYDKTGHTFSFETQTVKPGGHKGFADVFFRNHFIWEYKGPHKDLDKAYQQLQLYRESLENPPLLITSDIYTIHIHTNFNNYPTVKHTLTFDDILTGGGVEKLRWAFFQPEKFRPERTQEQITQASADTFVAVADAMKKHQQTTGETYSSEQLAHFMARLLFCLFAEDMKLLPANIFTFIIKAHDQPQGNLRNGLQSLFERMRRGGNLIYEIRHFDGTLFDDEFVPEIPGDLVQALLQATTQDWSAIDPAIFGTLFERVIDQNKRSQLGAHYTSEQDILLIVEPVLMEPLRRQWDTVRRQADRLLAEEGRVKGEERGATSSLLTPRSSPLVSPSKFIHSLLADFANELAAIRVLDPACGSGNFLYVALRQLLGLQKEVISYAARHGLPEIPLTVSPEQLYGIEINVYAHELAQITAWIGYLQWRRENGFEQVSDPVLRPLFNIKRMDAILAYDENGRFVEPTWPPAEIIMGNPPFLGSQRQRNELGTKYLDDLHQLYQNRIPGQSDLVCYWFEKARALIKNQQTKRAGLLATNSIRGGANRTVLERIKNSGNIFMAWSDNPWILEGAAVRVSIVGFDDGELQIRKLDGKTVTTIHADLTADVNTTIAKPLDENKNLAFQGPVKVGAFEIEGHLARKMLAQENPNRVLNSDVIKPWMNGLDITRRPRDMWIIDFDKLSLEAAASYEAPFEYVAQNIKPTREANADKQRRTFWWRLGRTGGNLHQAKRGLKRFILTPRVSKHRLFIWVSADLVPDSATVALTREDDYFLGVLHSHLHEIWSLRLGTWLGVGNDPRYTPTTTFETFPFPWPPGQEPPEDENELVAEIAYWARELVRWRENWLNPPRPNGLDVVYQKQLQNRTLTNLYNGLVYYRQTVKAGKPFVTSEFGEETRHALTRIEAQELDDIHVGLDTAVFRAYNWPPTLPDELLLERLLQLNAQRIADSEQ